MLRDGSSGEQEQKNIWGKPVRVQDVHTTCTMSPGVNSNGVELEC